MSQAGQGIWFTCVVTVTRGANGKAAFDASFDYENEPSWRIPPGADAYRRDLERYPRADDQVPPWYPVEAE
ncbi:MAG: hypothetical protein M3Y77_10795 [Actinomycetota bacterium]|nr:hypothetical protein [Actinomycetota bacterium]